MDMRNSTLLVLVKTFGYSKGIRKHMETRERRKDVEEREKSGRSD
jgi:hypothetical protein